MPPLAMVALAALQVRAAFVALTFTSPPHTHTHTHLPLPVRCPHVYKPPAHTPLPVSHFPRSPACFLDSMATLDLPAWGYGIRYTYGIFKQVIRNGAQVGNRVRGCEAVTSLAHRLALRTPYTLQVEMPDYWLTFGNPWEIERVDIVYPVGSVVSRLSLSFGVSFYRIPSRRTWQVRYYGTTRIIKDATGKERSVWEGGEVVQAIAYDNPIPGEEGALWAAVPFRPPLTVTHLSLPPGFDTWNTINLRLFRAAPAREFDLASFNTGDYMRAVEQRQRAETITSVLYPSDSTYSGKELRLKQQYFFVSATIQDVMRRFKRMSGWTWSQFASKNAIQVCRGDHSRCRALWQPPSPRLHPPPPPFVCQLNDTHPSIAIPELMRVLVDEEGLEWDEAWGYTVATFGYTNHTILPEALEKWSVELMGNLLPRHLEIIYKINWNFMEVWHA